MRKKVLIIMILIFAISGLSACGKDIVPTPPIPGQNMIVEYDNTTKTLVWSGDKTFANVEIRIGGNTHKLTGNSYDINTLNLGEGEYLLEFSATYDGQFVNKSFPVEIGQIDKNGFRIDFIEENNRPFKTIYRDEGYVLTDKDFPTILEKKGVTYSWSVEVGETVTQDVQIMLLADYIEYSITYNLNGGTIDGETTCIAIYTVRDMAADLQTPIKENFLFGGWYENADFSGNILVNIDFDNPRDYILFAKWKDISQDERDLLTYSQNTINLKYFMQTQSYLKTTTEIAVDMENYYYHRKENGVINEVLRGNMFYQYLTKIKTPVTNEYADSIINNYEMPSFAELMISATLKGTSGGVKKYDMVTIQGVMSVEITNDIISKIEMVDNGETLSLTISTAKFDKITPNDADFSEQIDIKVIAIGQDDGREELFKAKKGGTLRTSVNSSGQTFDSLRDSWERNDYYWTFAGYFTDQECTKPFSLDTVVTNSLTIYAKSMDTLEYYKNTEITVNLHCECSTCKNEVKNFKFIYSENMPAELMRHLAHNMMENGKISHNAYVMNEGKEQYIDEENLKSYILGAFFAEGNGDVVIDLYRKFSETNTYKVIFHCDCGEHTNGICEKYYSDMNHDINMADGHNWNGKYPYLYKDKDFNEPLYNLSVYQDAELYINWVEDTRTVVTYDYLDETLNENYVEEMGEHSDIINGVRTFKIWQSESGDRRIITSSAKYPLLNDKVIEAWYYDRAFERPVGKDDLITEDVVVYAKWLETKEVKFIIDSSFNSEIHKELIFSIAVGKDILWNLNWNEWLLEIYSIYDNDNMSSDEFYKDAGKTNKIEVYDGTFSRIYVGKQKSPTMTIVCECGRDGVSHKVVLPGGRLNEGMLNDHFKGDRESISRPDWFWSEVSTNENRVETYKLNKMVFFDDFTIYARFEAPSIIDVTIKESSLRTEYELYEEISDSDVLGTIIIKYNQGLPQREESITKSMIWKFDSNIAGTFEVRFERYGFSLNFKYTVVDSRPKIIESTEFDITYYSKEGQLSLKTGKELVNSVTEYDFNGKFTVESGATWKLYSVNQENLEVEIVDRIARFDGESTNQRLRIKVTKNDKTMVYNLNLQKKDKIYLYFNSDGGSDIEKIEVFKGEPYILPEPIRNGYDFKGWFIDEIKLDGKSWEYTYNRTAQAKWELATYTITYEINGGTIDGAPTSSYTFFSSEIILLRPTKTGFTFDGWYINADFTGDEILNIPCNSYGNKVLYAKWIEGSGDLVYTINSDGTYEVDSYNGTDTIVIIPSSHLGKDVTTIGGMAFYARAGLTSITLPDTLTSIGESAFYGCTGLTSITLPDTILSIGDLAFVNCTGLKGISIPASVKTIGQNAFNGCVGLTRVTFGANSKLTTIEWYAFGGCTRLASIIIPNSVTTIRNYAFSGCASLTSVTFEKESLLETIEEGAFNGCTSLTNLTIPNSVTSIEWGAFEGCTGLTNLTISSSVTSIEGRAFKGCTGLTSVTFGANSKLTTIGQEVFEGCLKIEYIETPAIVAGYIYSNVLKTVVINSGTFINSSAFEGCAELKSITLPDTITTIGYNAFKGCTSLMGVYIDDIAKWCDIQFGGDYANPLSYAQNLYIKNQLTKELTIPDGVTTIGAYAFDGCFSLTKITLPDTITLIEGYSFKGCTGLTSLEIPKSVTTYEMNIFSGCSNLKKLTLPAIRNLEYNIPKTIQEVVINGGEYIPEQAFMDCKELTSLTIHSVTLIGGSAFKGCSSLTSFEIPNSVTLIGGSAFDGCIGLTSVYVANITKWCSIKFDGFESNPLSYAHNLYIGNQLTTEITIPNSVTAIGNSAFAGGSNLTSITLPKTITSIGQQAFNGCTGLSSIIIPNGVTTIGYSTFRGCTGLTSLEIPNSVTTIEGSAFWGCSSLESINIPNLVTIIGNSAFGGCKALTSVDFGDNSKLTKIEYNAFGGCTGLTSINIPNSVTTIEGKAFYGCSSLARIIIPNSVTTIEGQVFDGCLKIEYIETPAIGVGYIKSNALKEIVINGGTSITSKDFEGCTAVTKITVPAIICLENVIPKTIQELIISSGTEIPYRAFMNYTALTSVTLSDTITKIGTSAFEGCLKIEYLKTPAIGAGAIESKALKTVVISSGTSLYGFNDCTALTSVTLSDTITTIGNWAFEGCTGLTSLTIPNLVTTIEGSAFRGCSSLASITLPDTLTTIGQHAFGGCSSLASITLPDTLETIGSETFSGCSRLASIIIPNSVTTIGERAFSYSVAYSTNKEKPTGWDNNWAVSYVFGFDHFVVDGGLVFGLTDATKTKTAFATVIKQSSNVYSAEIKSKITYNDIEYPVEKIEKGAFDSCTSLMEIKIHANDNIKIYKDTFISRCLIVYTEYRSNEILKDKGWEVDEIIVYRYLYNDVANDGYIYTIVDGLRYRIKNPNVENERIAEVALQDQYLTTAQIPSTINYMGIDYSVTTIGNVAFSGCSNLTSITLPDTITTISGGAFRGCSSLTSITLPKYVATIGAGAFGGCTGLTSLTLPENVKTIGDNAFEGCTGLTSLTIPYGVTRIGDNAFEGCSSLTSITLPDTLTTISRYMLYGCGDKLTTIIIPIINRITVIPEILYGHSTITTLIIQSGDIPADAFRGCTGLTNIDISGVTTIGNSAFNGCTGLTSIKIPNSVTSIGELAFRDCINLASLTFEGGSQLETIGGSAFFGCNGLTSLTIPNRVTTIENSAFRECFKLASITFEDGSQLETIGGYAFSGCSITSITIPSSVITIGENAFWHCIGLTSITIPNKVKTIGDSAFRECFNLASITFEVDSQLETIGGSAFFDTLLTSIIIPKSVKSISLMLFGSEPLISNLESITFEEGSLLETIGNSAFRGCTALTSITIPNSVKTIGEYSFNGCTGLTSITIPNNVTTIGANAFNGCTGLTSITIPNNVTSIGDYAFSGCVGLTSITIQSGVTTIIGNYAFSGCSGLTSITIPNSVTSIGDYAFSGCDKLTSITFEAGSLLESIGANAFNGRSGLTKITIPNKVKTIGDNAFSGCTGLISITFDEGSLLEKIGKDAFSGCLGLTSLTIPNSVTSIGDNAFSGCLGLTKLTLPTVNNLSGLIPKTIQEVIINGGTDLPNQAFENCSNLTSITISNSVTTIGNVAFSGCTGLTSITFEEGSLLESIGANAFNGRSGLTKITIPNKVKTIGDNAFSGCTGLTSITFEEGSLLESIGANAFIGCTGLTSITIPNNVTTIGNSAFDGCTGLTSVNFGTGSLLETIKYRAFMGCTGLTSINIPNKVKTIGDSAFDGCTGLTSITIPSSVTTIGGGAFEGCVNLVIFTNNTTLSWRDISQQVIKGCTFDKDNKYVVSFVKTYTINQAITPVRDGYTFGGWFTNAEFTGNALDPKTALDGSTLYAKWTENI